MDPILERFLKPKTSLTEAEQHIENLYHCSFPPDLDPDSKVELKKWIANYGDKQTSYNFNADEDFQEDVVPSKFTEEIIEIDDGNTDRFELKRKERRKFCDGKLIPRWAEHLELLQKISSQQKKNIPGRVIFGKFRPIKNFNIGMVMKDGEKTYDRSRGQSYFDESIEQFGSMHE